MKKRLISLIIAMTVLVSCAVSAMAVTFSDVSPSSWYYTYVTELSNAGVINGYDDGTFRPDATVTYGQALKLILLATGSGEMQMTGSHWASGYYSYAFNKEYISISEEELDKNISRLEIADLANKILKLAAPSSKSPFADSEAPCVIALYEKGIFTGSVVNGELCFCGGDYIKRSEISAVIYRIMNTDLRTEDGPEENVEILAEDSRIRVTCSGGLNLRTGPSTDYDIITALPTGATASALKKVNGWYEVIYGDNTGYVCGDFCRLYELKPGEVTEFRKELIEYAQEYISCPYVYAASGPDKFDCSGFTRYVFLHFGIELSHSARAQYAAGIELSQEELVPGDLVFFSNYETTWIGHVGIYIGNGEFVHASSSKGVVISSFESGWYYDHYITACRIISD